MVAEPSDAEASKTHQTPMKRILDYFVILKVKVAMPEFQTDFASSLRLDSYEEF